MSLQYRNQKKHLYGREFQFPKLQNITKPKRRVPKRGSNGELIDIGGGGRLDVEVNGVVRGGPREHESSVLGLFVVFEIGGAYVDARAAFKRREKGGGDVGAHPVSDPIQLITRHEAAALLHR
ncbi:hypothetical protein Dsin_025899 [Dipteronia sinensis]|uniref:Uncharacterized protein n=1 Tax=Dipteronia sinensis TaxID=43782 RepID=A0AAD9ZX60_9ROSI|nr:hypothetical protein Dsin_025899 [Dipteronia sinensis]